MNTSLFPLPNLDGLPIHPTGGALHALHFTRLRDILLKELRKNNLNILVLQTSQKA